MTIIQFSRLQRMVGKLEGLAYGLPDEMKAEIESIASEIESAVLDAWSDEDDLWS